MKQLKSIGILILCLVMFTSFIEAYNLEALNEVTSDAYSAEGALPPKKKATSAKKTPAKKSGKDLGHPKNKTGKKLPKFKHGLDPSKYHLPHGHEKYLRVIKRNGKIIPVIDSTKLKLRVWPLASELSTHFISVFATSLGKKPVETYSKYTKSLNKENPGFNILTTFRSIGIQYKVSKNMIKDEKRLKALNINTLRGLLLGLKNKWPKSIGKIKALNKIEMAIHMLKNVSNKNYDLTNIYAKIAIKKLLNIFKVNKKVYEKPLEQAKWLRLKMMCGNENKKLPAKKSAKGKVKKPAVSAECKEFFKAEKAKKEAAEKKAKELKAKLEKEKKKKGGDKKKKDKKSEPKGKKTLTSKKKKKFGKLTSPKPTISLKNKLKLKTPKGKKNQLVYTPNTKEDTKVVSHANITVMKMRILAYKLAKMVDKLIKLKN